MATSIAIRLGVEGGAELKRVLDDAGTAGQAAFQKVGAAADQAAVATDRQTARWRNMAQAAREAEAQARAQANVNALLGVGSGSAGAARDSASVFEAELARQDQIRAARQEQAARAAQSNVNTLLGVREAQAGAARASAAAFEEAYRAETDAMRRAAEARTTIVRNTVAGWRDLGASGAAALANIEAGRRLGSLNGLPQAANQNVAGRRLRSDEITNLIYQGGDVTAQLGSGSPLSMIALQQGPQIAQIFAGPGGASVKGAFSQAGEAVAGFVGRIGLVGGAIGGATAAFVAGVAATISYRSSQQETEKVLAGVGRTSGVTLSQINDLADAQVRAGNFSRRGARDVLSIFAGTGSIGSEVLGGAGSATRDFSRFLGVDSTEGATQLASALNDVSRGADDLGQRYGILNAAQAENIRRMDAQGDRLGAQKALLEAVRASTRGVAEETRGWALVTQTVGTWWDRLGQTLDRFATGGSLETRIADLRRVLESRSDSYLPSFLQGLSTRPALQAELDELLKRQRVGQEQSEAAQIAQRSFQVGNLLRSLSPDQEELKRLTDQGVLLRKAITDPMSFGLRPEQTEAAKRAFGELSTSVRNLVEDIDRFGSRAAAALNRAADFNAQTVGATPFGRSAAQINKEFDDKLRDAKEDERASIEQARQKELETLRRTQALEQTQRGGAFSRAPSGLREQILAATQRFPTVDTAILAGLLEQEGGFYNTGPTRVLGRDGRPASTAWGRGQITDAAEKDIRKIPGMEGFDKYNVETQVMGAAAYLSLRQQWAGGDQIKALNGYGTGPGYGLSVMRRAGQLGDVSTLSLEREQDARNRALQQERDALRLTTEAGGRDREGTLARIEAMKAISDAAARGIPVSQAYAAQLGREASERQRILTAGRLFQFANDNAFDREQLGRTQIDAAAFARARSTGLDPSDPRFAGVVEASRLNDGLRETKSLANEAFGGMLSDLRQSTSLVSTLGNLTNRVADRIFSIAADRTISSLFTGTGGTSGEGPFAAVASFLFGGTKADGGLLTGPGGPRADNLLIRASAGEYVINAASVSHYGPGFFDSLNNRAMARFADGGLIGREAFTTPRSTPMRAENANASPSGLTLNVINQVPAAEVQTREVSDGRGGRREEMVIVEAVASATRHPLVQSAQSRPRVAAR